MSELDAVRGKSRSGPEDCGPLAPCLLLVGRECVDTVHLVDAAVGRNREFDGDPASVLEGFLSGQRRGIRSRWLCVCVKRLEPSACADGGTLAFGFYAEDVHAEQTLDIDVCRGRSLRPGHGALRLGLSFQVVGDAVGDGLAGLELREKVETIGMACGLHRTQRQCEGAKENEHSPT